MTRLETLLGSIRGARTAIQLDRTASDRERANARLFAEIERVLAQPHLYDMDAMTAIHDVLKSQGRSTLATGTTYWTADRELHDRGIAKLFEIYPVDTIELAEPPAGQ